ncbi:DNA ligase 3 [Colletotrichum trifolii]|uniref:DNA ligase 3 n=1 Tax=Colletotrichum trifolii TaxID=5466 RepID=A0A4R8R011_COLTR|nr:DNA ligase 3 [Colletotrichum trifolii]
MPSPTKKRKLNDQSSSGVQSRSLEYFFSKQKQKGTSTPRESLSEAAIAPLSNEANGSELTDEELARKLQAEWDAEVQNERAASTPCPDPTKESTPQLSQPDESAAPAEPPAPTVVVPQEPKKNTLSLSSVANAEDTASATVPLDQSPLTFDTSEFVPQLKANWAAEGGRASYAFLTRCFVLVNGTQSRIKIVDTLVNCIRVLIEADPESLLPAVWLATNAISPPYISLELGLGGSAISKALRQVCGLDNRALKAIYDKHGDAGDVAFKAKKKQSFTLRKPKPLTIQAVYQSLVKIANSQGHGSGEAKQRIVDRLLQDARGGEESRYIVRTLCQHLRIGAVKTTMLIALSRAFVLSRPPGAEFPLRSVQDLQRLKKDELAEGRDFACEFKYDGQRAQIHCDDKGKVTIFSRHLELMTDKYPDLVALMPKIRGEGVDSFIMEGEVVAVDKENGELKNFQTLSNRARKDVAIGSVQVNVCMFAFDLMFLNGQPLLDRPFRERRELLRSMFLEVPHQFTWVKNLDATSQDSEAVLDFFKQATEIKCEGIMVKILDNLTEVPYQGDEAADADGEAEQPKIQSKSKKGKTGKDEEVIPKKKGRRKPLLATYEPDKRLDSWLKVKKDYNSSFDTIDMIPVAGWHGQGRKAKWWSPILMAVRNEESGSFEVVCKCMSGFTDAFYKANREFYDDGEETGGRNNTRARKPAFVEYSGPVPDVWFEPQEVWEMAFADITLSPTYTAAIGLVSEERGLSLRFPRFLKKREDKGLDEASTNEFLAGLWRKQEAKAPTKDSNGGGTVDDDFEE